MDPEFLNPSVKDVEVARKNGTILIDFKQDIL